MCLVKIFPGFKTAREDIKVYKILNKNRLFNIYKSPYQCTPYILNKEYTSVLCDSISHITERVFIVEEGLHTFLNKDDAIKHCLGGSSSWVVCEAVIPKGSKYAIGVQNDVVSNRLIVIKEIWMK